MSTVEVIETGPPPPSGFKLGDPPIYYDVSTTVSYNGMIDICLNYDEALFEDEADLKLMHWDGEWQDVTVSLDTLNNIICGQVSSLSAFTVMEPPIQAAVDITPNTLNLKSNGAFVTTYIQLPEGYNVANIVPETVYMEGIPAITDSSYDFVTDPEAYLLDLDGDGTVETYMLKFDRALLVVAS